ncbi:MAG TPA: phosphate ABC transporter substrate-binding protein PstS [Candidatus Sulfotelmatobacter sp.]|nr:phosphate ABC transporter substrate-binding protein PstS [Candidatus Sulfotelmatobacter sp.]
MSKYDSSSGQASKPLLTIQISKSGGVMILIALAVIAVLVGMDLRARARAQATPKAADDAVAVAESKPDLATITPEPAVSESPSPQHAEVHIIKPGPAYEAPVKSAPIQNETYSSERPNLQPVAAALPTDVKDAPQPASPTPAKPTATHESRPIRIRGPLSLAGAGTAFPYPIYEKWFTQFREQVVREQGAAVRIDYQPAGSSAGIRQTLDGTVDFGATDIPLSDDQMLKANGKVLHLPTVLRAVVPIYNLPVVTGEIRFSSEVLADIYLGNIVSWNDDAIVRENPGRNLPNQEIVVVHRSDPSPATSLFTDFLSKVSDQWRTSVGTDTSVKWPIGLGAKGDDGVAESVHQLEGAIGYVDMRYAKENRLPTASVGNSSGKFVTATLESLTQAAASVPDIPPDFRFSIANARGAKAYPIAGFTWLLVPTEPKRNPRRAALLAFLRWMADDGEKMTNTLDYAPLPENLSTEVRQRIAQLR